MDQKLREHLINLSDLVQVAEKAEPASQDQAKPKPCLALGICVCTRYPDSAFLFANMSMYFRKVFWKKRKDKVCSMERTLLDSFLIVLEFKRVQTNLLSLPLTAGDDDGDDWDSMYIKQAMGSHVVDTDMQPLSIFLHIGRIDLRSWHFGAVQLHVATSENPCQGVTFLEPHEDEISNSDSHCTYSALEVFAHKMCLDHPWSIRLHQISMTESDWNSAPHSSIAVRVLESTGDFTIWQGRSAEKERRKLKEAAKTKTRKRKDGNSQRAQRTKRARKQKPPPALGDVENEDVDFEAQDGVGGGIFEDEDDLSFNPLQNEDPIEDILIPNGCFSAGGAFADDEDERVENEQSEPELLVENQDEIQKDGSECRSPKSDLDEFLESADEETKEEAELVGPPVLSEPAEREVEVAEPTEPPPEREPVAVDRPLGVSRSNLNRTVFLVGTFGELHYYHLSEQMVAFCSLRTSSHEGCRKQMTTNPQRRGSGRPIGMLVAWLQKAHLHDSKYSHIHSAVPTYQDRLDARKYFESLPGSEHFSTFERPKKIHEDSEPRNV